MALLPTHSALWSNIDDSRLWSNLSSCQVWTDALLEQFTQGVSDWQSLCAMTLGGLAFRVGKIAALSTGFSNVRFIGNAFGLVSEVTAFEASHRSLQYLTGNYLNPNSLRWSGSGGFWEGWRNSFVNFGLLKLGGAAAQSSNIILQHLFQDTAMLAGNHVSASLGWNSKPHGNLFEQFLNAEVTNLQLGLGMAFVRSFVPGIHLFERSLEVACQARKIFIIQNPLEKEVSPSLFSMRTNNTEGISSLMRELRDLSLQGRWTPSSRERSTFHHRPLHETVLSELNASAVLEKLETGTLLGGLTLSFAKRLTYLEIRKEKEFNLETVRRVAQSLCNDLRELHVMDGKEIGWADKWVLALEKMSAAELRDLFLYTSNLARDLALPTQSDRTFVAHVLRSKAPREDIEGAMRGWKEAYEGAKEALREVPEAGDLAKTIAGNLVGCSNDLRQKAIDRVKAWQGAYQGAQRALALHPDMSDLAREIARLSMNHEKPLEAVTTYIKRWNDAFEEANKLLSELSDVGNIARSIASNAYTSPKPRVRVQLSLTRWQIAYETALEAFGKSPDSGNVARDLALRCMEVKDPKKTAGTFVRKWTRAFEAAEKSRISDSGIGPSSRLLANASYDAADPLEKVRSCTAQWRSAYREIMDAQEEFPGMGSIAKSIADQVISSSQNRHHTQELLRRWREAYQEALKNLDESEEQAKIAKTIADNAFMFSDPREQVRKLIANWRLAFDVSQSRSIALQAMRALRPESSARQALAAKPKSRNGMEYLREAISHTLIGRSIQSLIQKDLEIKNLLESMANEIHTRQDAETFVERLGNLYLKKGLGLDEDDDGVVHEYLPKDGFSFSKRT